MSLGGGTFVTQNKVLPGSYINFISAARADATLSDRGIVAMPVELSWGAGGVMTEMTAEEFLTDSLSILGAAYDSAEAKPFREIFCRAKKVYFYRLNEGEKAKSDMGTAKYGGVGGNKISVKVEEAESLYKVTTIYDGTVMEEQTVSSAEALEDNDWVIFDGEGSLSEGTVTFSGGTDKSEVSTTEYQAFLDAAETVTFHTLICPTDKEEIKKLFVQFTKMMRNQYGVKFQTVVYQYSADDEGIINVCSEAEGDVPYGFVYWVGGASGGCNVNQSVTNAAYDGEFTLKKALKQSELEDAVKEGKFVFHGVGQELRVLTDINSFVSFTVEKSKDFSYNQVIRVLDQIGNDVAVIFNTRYLGKVQNNDAGRLAFWGDIVALYRQMVAIGAVTDFDADAIEVTQGQDKKRVAVYNPVTPACAMEKLYMTVVIQ